MAAAIATGCARLARMALTLSLKNVSNKPRYALHRKIAGCSLDGMPALGLSLLPTEREREHSHLARSGR